MSNNEIIRAWKDEDYFESLSEEQRSLLPENPVGIVELSDEDMEVIAAGSTIRSHFGKPPIDVNIDFDNNVDIDLLVVGVAISKDDINFSQNNAAGAFCSQ